MHRACDRRNIVFLLLFLGPKSSVRFSSLSFIWWYSLISINAFFSVSARFAA